MRKKFVAGNWKMNLDWNEAMSLMAEVTNRLKSYNGVDVGVFPPALYLRHFVEFTANCQTPLIIGAQDCSAHTSGAFTGEIAAAMIASVGATHCIIGHSERRQYHHENSDILNAKIKFALEAGLHVVYCCGESFQERESGNQSFVIDNQLDSTIFTLSAEQMRMITIAYEPVWAIGTGKTASPEQAQDMHEFIRGLLQSRYGVVAANEMRILYGGSVNVSNAASLFEQPDIDGALVGGASLKLSEFLAIIAACK